MKIVAVALFVVAATAIQGAVTTGKPEDSALQQLATNTQNVVQNVSAILQGNLPESKEVVRSINQNAQTLANHVQEIVNKLKTEVKTHQGDIDNVIKKISENLSDTRATLERALGPDGQKKAEEIKQKLEEGLKNAAAEAEKLTKAIEPEAEKVRADVSNAAKTFLDQIVTVSKNIQEQIGNAEKKN